MNNSFENFSKFYSGTINLIPLNDITQSIEKIKFYYNNEDYAYIMVNSLNKTAIIINLLKKINPYIHIIIFPWINDEYLINLVDNKKNIILPGYFSKNSEFEKTFLTKYDKRPNIYAYTIYQALEILDYSYKKVENIPEKMITYILNNEFNSKFGTIRFDKNGEINRKLTFRVIE
ncbi:hypothetical protein [Marinitoga lauensis]|uniref:hypothetical protein n=1 Tax=Marinitoga lauensis TaxID=2201189 RepID=UPI00101025A0|nr:hypothetical protein [Marinitoga lauensis]